jgi:hypothetical protein
MTGSAMLRIVVLFVFLAFANVDANRVNGDSPDAKVANPDTLVLCPPKFQAAMKTWTDYRTRQGHCVTMLTPAPTPRAIKQQIREAAVSGDLKNVLIVGDSGDERSAPGDLVTTDYIAAKVNVRFGSEPEIATDNTYADLDNDGIPDLTIGRMPIDTVEEIECFTNRIIEYESHACSCDWRRRINFIAGVGGFGQVIDGLIEQTTKQMITDLVPNGYETTMTYGSWCSPYCPDPRRFSESAITRFNEGCMFWVYLGHGDRHQLDNVRMPDQNHSILDNTTVSQLKCQCGNPIAIFLACYTGATDGPQDCLAETMMRQEDGPIAAICGTRVTMPYAMSLLSLEMVHEFFEGEAKTIGELTLLAKQRLVNGSDNNREYRAMIEGMGKTFSPTPNMLKLERLEHVQLIHLIGDPLLRLKRPGKIEIESPASVTSGSQFKLAGKVPAGGRLTLELAYERDRLRHRPVRRKEYDSSEASFQDYQQTYEQSQDLVCSSKVITVSEGEFSTEFAVPAEASGRCVVRAMLESENLFAIGSSPIEVKKVPNVRSAERTILSR